MMRLIALFFIATAVQAGTVAVPLPATPSSVPSYVAGIGDCVGVSDAGVIACNATWGWRPPYRFSRYTQAVVAYTYNLATGQQAVLQAMGAGLPDAQVHGMTAGGRAWGAVTGRSGAAYVEWDSAGNVRGLPGFAGAEVVDCDDLGRCAAGNKTYNPATGIYETVPGAIKIYALNNSGDSAGVFGWVDVDNYEHTGIWRTKDFAARTEDQCVYPCIGEPVQMPVKVVYGADVVGFYFNYSGYPSVGYTDSPLRTIRTIGATWSGINAAGTVVGANMEQTRDGVLSTIPLGAFSSLSALGINASGIIVGAGKLGTVQRGFVYTP